MSEARFETKAIRQAHHEARVPLKVVHLMGLLSEGSGGLHSSVPGLIKGLVSVSEIDQQVVGAIDPAYPPDALHWGAPVHAYASYGPRNFHWAPELSRGMERIAPDLIDSHGVWMNLSRVALEHHNKRGTPFLVTPHGMLDPWAVRRSERRKRLVRWWFEDEHLSKARVIRALNRDEAVAIRQFGVTTPVAIIPNGISPPQVERISELSDRPAVLEFLGRLDPKKGLEPLLIAWSIVMREAAARHWTLRIHGWGPPAYVESLQGLIEQLDIGMSVELAGPVFGPQKDDALGSASGFILPSFSEGLPMAVLEAWSWGTPVLMTRACNLPEGFSEGAAIEITTEPSEIANGILDFIAMNIADRRAMAFAGRRLVKTNFHSHSIAVDMERLYRWVAGLSDVPSDLMFEQ